MKNLSTYLRHLVTALAGISAYLATLPTGTSDAAEPVAGLAMVAAVAVTRLVLALVGNLFAAIAEKSSGGMSGGMLPLMVGLAAGIVGSLPSCAALESTPVRACLITERGTICYSQDGASAAVNLRSGK
jgi:hypothetical protein